MNQFESIRQRLIREVGFKEEYLEARTLRWAARERMSALGIDDESGYWRYLAGNHDEIDALRDLSLVPETSFFRDQIPFEFLPTWFSQRREADRPIRILSAPCSTGEEPYSIAMSLVAAGASLTAFKIDALDISQSVLHTARRAIYPRSRLRNLPAGFLDRYFTKTGADRQIVPELQHAVTFTKANLTDSDFPRARTPYDCVFCRNLLVYLTDAGRQQVLANITHILAPEGLLVVGHAEASYLGRGGNWISVPPVGAFSFQQRKVPSPAMEKPLPTTAHRTFVRDRHPGVDKVSNFRRSAGRASPTTLDRIEQLADAGRLEEAATLCEDVMKHFEPNGRACYLLGIIRSATGRTAEAHELFEKAVQLDPDNLDFRMHLEASRRDREPAPISNRRPSRTTLRTLRPRS